jgi:hypothetical protein
VNRVREIADRAAGRLQGAWDTVRGTAGYEPLAEGREPGRREKDTYGRWLEHRDPRNAYERAAFASFPREIEAEIDRVDAAAAEWEAADQAEREAEDRADWDAFMERDQKDMEAGQ